MLQALTPPSPVQAFRLSSLSSSPPVMTMLGTVARAETKFAHTGVDADAKRYEAYLKANWSKRDKGVKELKADGSKAMQAGTDFRAAARAYAQIVVAEPGDSEAWTSLARALLAIKPGEYSSERYELR